MRRKAKKNEGTERKAGMESSKVILLFILYI
jgi:hypothetical protein